MSLRGLGGALCAFALLAMPAFADDSSEIGWTSHLDALGINGEIDQLGKAKNYKWHKISSEDGASDDTGVVRRYPNEVVLADVQGPGCITRIYVENPSGSIRIYVDDMENPVIAADLNDFFSGGMEVQSRRGDVFVEPLVGTSGGGSYSYVPFPYEERCVIVVKSSAPSLTYQVEYAEFPDGTPLKSFRLDNDREDGEYFDRWKENWSTAHYQFYDRENEILRKSDSLVYPFKDVQLYTQYGPGTITELEFWASSKDRDALKNASIQVYYDGAEQPAIDAPLGDFFGSNVSYAGNFDTVPFGRDHARMWNRLPMPYQNNIQIRIVNNSEHVLDLKYNIVFKPGPTGDSYYLHAQHAEGTNKAGESVHLARIQGPGHFVGLAMSATGGETLSFLDGDDTIIVDGRHYRGTGTDDFFNAGWYFSENPYSGSLAGGSAKKGGAPTAFAASRVMVNDAVPFENSFRLDFEHGNNNSTSGITYRALWFWYQDTP